VIAPSCAFASAINEEGTQAVRAARPPDRRAAPHLAESVGRGRRGVEEKRTLTNYYNVRPTHPDDGHR